MMSDPIDIYESNCLAHYGAGHDKGGHSGRYPWGSREHPRGGTVYGGKTKIDLNNRDHSKSNKTELYQFLAVVTYDTLTLNPLGLGYDLYRGGAAAVSHVKTKKFDKERLEDKTDKKTGLPLKSKEYTPNEDLARVNPNVYNFDANTKNNCMLCTTAYDMRMRGYDVRANKASYGYMSKDLNHWYPGVKIKDVKGFNEKGKKSTKAAIATLKDEIIKQGDGARGNLMVSWKSGGGHSMVYEVHDNQMVIKDAQVNKVYMKPERVLNRCTSELQYARLDNIKFNPQLIKEACG